MGSSYLKKFTGFILRNRLLQPTEPVLLAVSGGVDSVVMSRLFSLAQFKFGMAHCNFKLRGKDSNDDKKFVETLAHQLGVPFHSVEFETEKHASQKGISVEMAARDLRYQWLEETRKTHGYHKIATAHHRDDSIETVLLNLIKGTGISGLHGILPLRGTIIRPMLAFSKKEILDFAAQEKLSFRQDYTNLQSAYQRNFLRNEIIPRLKELNPDFMHTFSGNIEKFRDAEVIFKKGLEHIRKRLLQKKGEEWYIPLKKLLLLEGNKTILYELLKDFGFGEKQAQQVYDGIQGEPGSQYFSEKFRVIKDRSFLIIASRQEDLSGIVLVENIKKPVKLREGTLKFHLKKGAQFREDAGSDVAYIDYCTLHFPLVLRRWQPGDYFYPLGMNSKKKKLSDFLTDLRISALDKERAWVLLSGEQIVWVVGYRIDERFKVTGKTPQTLMMKWN